MADPITIIGAVAASTQVIQQAYNISKFFFEVYSEIKEAPAIVSSRFRHVEQLIEVSKLVQQTPSLQTAEVAAVLKACYDKSTTLYSKLKELLVVVDDRRWQKLKKSLTTLMQKKELVDLFNDLEREKSTLILCLQAIQPSLLATIDDKVVGVARDVTAIRTDLPHLFNHVESVHSIASGMSDQVAAMHNMLPDLMRQLQVYQLAASSAKSQIAGAYGVPNRRVRGFLGRDDVLETLSNAVPSPGATEPCIVVIRGIGGQGKTQVALEFCRQGLEKKYFLAAFWVDASSETTTKKSFEAIYDKMNGAERSFLEPDAKVDFVRSALDSSNITWLLVFDNYDDPVSFSNVQDFFPEFGNGLVLITTRRAETVELADDGWFIELPGLAAVDGTALLLKQCQIPPSEKAKIEASVIVERLGHHPLAIAQAGTYISNRRIRLNQFLDHFDRRKELILQQTPHMSQYRRKLNEVEKETSLSVFTTWELSFRQLEAVDPSGDKSRILTLLAFFDCKDMSERLLQLYCERNYISPTTFEIIGVCLNVMQQPQVHGGESKYSYNTEEHEDEDDNWGDSYFTEIQKDDYEIRGRNRYSYDKMEENNNNEHNVDNHNSSETKNRNNDYNEDVRQKDIADLNDSDNDNDDDDYSSDDNMEVESEWNHDSFGDILNDLRQLSLIQTFVVSDDDCYHVTLHPLVNDWIRMRIKDTSSTYTYFSISVAVLHNMMQIIQDLQDTPDAYSRSSSAQQIVLANLDAIKKSLRQLEENQDQILSDLGDPVIESFEDFAEFLFVSGKYREALWWYRLTAKLLADKFGSFDEKALPSLSNLAYTMLHLEKYGEAKELAEKVIANLAQDSILQDPHHLLCARDVLANSLYHLGKLEESEEIYNGSIEIAETSASKGGLGTMLNNYGVMLIEAGKAVEAEPIKRRAREIQAERFGRFHHLSIEADNNYAMGLMALGRAKEAEEIALDGLQRCQAVLGPNNPLTIEIVDTIAQILHAQARYDEAERLCQQALSWRETHFGPKYHKTAESQTLMDKLKAKKADSQEEL